MTAQLSPNFQLSTINMDCAHAQAMADFYGRLLGWKVTWRDDGFILMENPDGGTGLSFQKEACQQPMVEAVGGWICDNCNLKVTTDDEAPE